METPDPGRPETGGSNTKGPEPLVLIINAIADRAEPLMKILSEVADRKLRAQEAITRFQVRMSWLAVLVVVFIVLSAAVMTYLGKLDGSTFGFLLGTVVGYVLTFIRDAIAPPGGLRRFCDCFIPARSLVASCWIACLVRETARRSPGS